MIGEGVVNKKATQRPVVENKCTAQRLAELVSTIRGAVSVGTPLVKGAGNQSLLNF